MTERPTKEEIEGIREWANHFDETNEFNLRDEARTMKRALAEIDHLTAENAKLREERRRLAASAFEYAWDHGRHHEWEIHHNRQDPSSRGREGEWERWCEHHLPAAPKEKA